MRRAEFGALALYDRKLGRSGSDYRLTAVFPKLDQSFVQVIEQ
jgi:hypothetical protein